MSALDDVRVLIGRERILAFWRHVDTLIVDAPEVPYYMKFGYEFICVDPDDRVTWEVHKDLAATLLRKAP